MFEQIIRKAGAARQDPRVRGRLDFDGDGIERVDGVERERGGGRATDTLARSAERFQNCQPRSTESALRQNLRQRRGAIGTGGQSQNPRAGLQMRADEIERTSMQRQQHRIRQRPAESGGRQTERRGRR